MVYIRGISHSIDSSGKIKQNNQVIQALIFQLSVGCSCSIRGFLSARVVFFPHNPVGVGLGDRGVHACGDAWRGCGEY
jgi:hypothetical protein